MTRDEALEHYRRWREIADRIQAEAMQRLSAPALVEQTRRLGLTRGRTPLPERAGPGVLLAFDLAFYTAKEGRSRPLDRHAKSAGFPPGSDEASVLDAMRRARFSLWRVLRRHEAAGLAVEDTLRGGEAWLMDEGIEHAAPDGGIFAGRLFDAGAFAMTCGIYVPVGEAMMEGLLRDPHALRRADPAQAADDPRFAAALYRAAVETGALDGVAPAVPEPG